MEMSTNRDWSKLCSDVLRKIFKTLESPVDYQRAKIVCSDWYSVWKTCSNNPPCPWRIMHQGDSSTRHKSHNKRKIIGLFSKTSHCMACSGNWLLMVDRRLKFYILNVLTLKKINLPSMGSQILGGNVRFEPGSKKSDFGHLVGTSGTYEVSYSYETNESYEWRNSVAVLWINETTKDYVVAWTFKQHYVFSYMKGNTFWSSLNLNERSLSVLDMACENNKLYLFTTDYHIKTFDFSGGFLTEKENPYSNHPFNLVEEPWEYVWRRKIAIRKSGEVLVVLSLKQVKSLNKETLLFYIFKMDLESYMWERVYSIGDEMLIFGHGVTLALAREDLGYGSKRDSIYFVGQDVWPDLHRVSNCGVFDIATSSVAWPKKIRFPINKTQWFVWGVAY